MICLPSLISSDPAAVLSLHTECRKPLGKWAGYRDLEGYKVAYNPYQPYQFGSTAPKATANPYASPYGTFGASQPAAQQNIPTNRNWASGVKAWDPQNIFSGFQTSGALADPSTKMGSTASSPTMGSLMMAPGATMGSTTSPTANQFFQLSGNLADPSSKMGMESGPVMGDYMSDPNYANQDPVDPSADPNAPFQPSAAYLARNAMVPQGMTVTMADGSTPTDVSAPTATDPNAANSAAPGPTGYQFTMADLMANMPNSQMPTMDQLQMDPGYQFRLNQGLNALQGSAAARGSLQSSGTMKDILDYSQGAASQEYQNAYNRFSQNQQFNANQIQDAWSRLNGDRSASQTADQNAFNQYANQRNFDQSQYQYNDTTGYNRYMDQVNGYNNLMGGAQKNDAALAGTGYTSAKDMGDLVTSSASALAQLGMSQAQIQAMSQMAASGQNTDMIKSLLSLAGVAIAAFA
jgi:hypothetical protein